MRGLVLNDDGKEEGIARMGRLAGMGIMMVSLGVDVGGSGASVRSCRSWGMGYWMLGCAIGRSHWGDGQGLRGRLVSFAGSVSDTRSGLRLSRV